jgi:hypothetical protein
MIDSAAEAGRKIKALAGTRATDDAFLTVTLSTSRLDDWRLSVPSFLRSELSRVAHDTDRSKETKRLLQEDLDYVLDIVAYEVTPHTQGLAVFVDGKGHFSERIELPFRLLNRVVVEPYPYVRPIAHALSLLEPFVLARVSRDESSLYLVDEWGIAQEDDLTGPWLRTSDRETGEVSIKEYFAAARQETLVEQHYKEVGVSLAKLLEASKTRRVALCAQHDIASAFRRSLPRAVAAHVVAELPFDAAATTGQMVVGARQAIEEARHREMEALASRIKESLGHGGHGVAGFDDVMAAVGLFKVQTLLVDRNFRDPGWRCPGCNWVSLVETKTCPVCGGRPEPVFDAVGEIVRSAILQNVQIEVGEDIAVLDELGGVAGLLRYA